MVTVPEARADLSGAIEDKVRRELPDLDLVRRIWNSVRDLRDVHGGVSEKAVANVIAGTLAGQSLQSRRENTPQGNYFRKCCQHTMRGKEMEKWLAEVDWRDTPYLWRMFVLF